MSHRILREKDGKYCIFSSIVDDVIAHNFTREQLVTYYLEEEKKKLMNYIENECGVADTHTPEQKLAIDMTESCRGIKRYNEVKELLGL